MKRMKHSVDLNAYIKECSNESSLVSTDVEGNVTLTIYASVGAAQDDDEKVGVDDFNVDAIQWSDVLVSQIEFNDPQDQFKNKRKEAQDTKNMATVVESYLVKMYNDQDSLLHHGCTSEMM